MARLIDADKIKKYMHMDDFGTPDERWMPESEFAALVDSQPTIDAEPVVRCRECKHYMPYCGSNCCDIFCDGQEDPYPTLPNDYCSYGEREDEV